MQKNDTKSVELKIVDLHLLKPYENNSKIHTVSQLEGITESIRRFGFKQPIVIDQNNVIVAGHGRYEAASALGYGSLPCIIADDLTDEEIRAYRILDNKLAEGGTDDSKLLIELSELDFDFSPFNVEFPEIEVLNEGLCDEDESPELTIEATSKNGDVWLLGNHRLMCGDSTMIDDVEKLMNGNKANMVFTDPPYGVNFEQGKFIGREKQGKDRNFDPIQNDDKKGDELKEFLKVCFTNVSLVCDIASIYVWSPPLVEGFSILKSLLESDWHIQSQIIWNKSPFVIGRADYHWKHEVCWYGYKGKNHQWHGGRDKATVWDVNKTHSSDVHPTMKPVELANIAVLNSSSSGNIVLDVFGGSGTTLIACEKTNRKCFMMEIAPNYCDVIIKRWQKFTGKDAYLESNNRTFRELTG